VRGADEAVLAMALAVANDATSEHTLGAALDAWSQDPEELSPSYTGRGALLGVVNTKGGVALVARRSR
jgi:hypothetical protein